GSTSYQAGRSAGELSLKRYRYTGKERDEETGFTYHGARYYAPWLGRWVSCDPAEPSRNGNLYDYSRCNPVTFSDPDGRDPQSDPFHLFGDSGRRQDLNAPRSGFNLRTGTIDPRYFPPPAVPNRQDIKNIQSTSPDRVLGRFVLSTVTGLIGEGTAGGGRSEEEALRLARQNPSVSPGEQALNIALFLLPVEKALGYVFKGAKSLVALEAKGAATTAEKAFLTELDEGFKTAAESTEKDVAANLARGNFGERIAADSLAADGHRIVSYKPDIA